MLLEIKNNAKHLTVLHFIHHEAGLSENKSGFIFVLEAKGLEHLHSRIILLSCMQNGPNRIIRFPVYQMNTNSHISISPFPMNKKRQKKQYKISLWK